MFILVSVFRFHCCCCCFFLLLSKICVRNFIDRQCLLATNDSRLNQPIDMRSLFYYTHYTNYLEAIGTMISIYTYIPSYIITLQPSHTHDDDDDGGATYSFDHYTHSTPLSIPASPSAIRKQHRPQTLTGLAASTMSWSESSFAALINIAFGLEYCSYDKNNKFTH